MTRRIVAIVAALAFALSACTQQQDPNNNGIASAQSGGASATSTGASPPPGAVYNGVQLAKCLRDQGIPVDDPAPGQEKPQVPEAVSGEQIDAAMRSCKQFAPNYGQPVPPVEPAQLERLRKFAQCMREQGVDWADPGPDGRPVEPPEPPPTDRGQPNGTGTNGPSVLDAAKVCSEKVPGTGITVEGGNGDGKKEAPNPR